MRLISAFTITLALFIASTTWAGDNPEGSARLFVQGHTRSLGMDFPQATLGDASHSVHLGQHILSFPVFHRDLPVFFHSVTVQIDDEMRVRRVTAGTNEQIDGDTLHPCPDGEPGRDWARMFDLNPSMVLSGWLRDPEEGLIPAIRVDVHPFAREPYSIYLDARSLSPVETQPLMWTADPLGSVFRENPITTPDVQTVSLQYLNEPKDILEGAYAHVGRCIDPEDCPETEPTAFPDDDGNFIFEPNLWWFTFDDPFSEVNAYHNISRINHWARETFEWEELFQENTWINVKVGQAWYNAAFYGGNDEIPAFIVFGQDVIDFAYDADVAFHEFGHAINRSIRSHPWYVRDSYGMDVSPFGIEEGLADIWATTYSGDPVMNSYVLLTRTADNDLVCPDDLMSEGHMEARILAGFGWDVRQRIGAHAWNHIVYRTLFFLESEAVFDDFVEALAKSAQDLAEEALAGPADSKGWPDMEAGFADIIMEEGAARGLFEDECLRRLVPLPDGTPKRVYGYGRERTNKRNRPTGLQWKITADDETKAFRLYLAWRYPDPEEVEPGYRVHISRGQPVGVSWLNIDDVEEGQDEFSVTADLTIEASPEFVDFPVCGLAPLKEKEDVYILISANTEERIFVVDAEAFYLTTQPPPLTDGGLPIVSTAATGGGPSCNHLACGSTNETPSLLAVISQIL